MRFLPIPGRRLVLAAIFIVATLVALQAAASGSQHRVINIRLGYHPDRVRLVFDLSDPVLPEYLLSENPDGLTLTLSNTINTADVSHIPLDKTTIKRIEALSTQNGDAVFNLSLSRQTRYAVFPLEAHAGRGYRVVLDLFVDDPGKGAFGKNADDHPSIADVTPGRRPPGATTKEAVGEDIPTAPVRVSNRLSGQWSGSVSLDARVFFHPAKYPGQDQQNASTAFQPEYYVDWSDDDQRFAFSPFFRYDANDSRRTHADIRELYWRVSSDRLLFKVGLDVVFWGVTESQHLVNIINQTDWVENIDGEDKLGQPMVNLDYLSDWGTWQLYLLPYFRERTFAGRNGRLRVDPPVDTDAVLYESGRKEKHTDFAVRWSRYLGDWDIGLAHFSGTARQPFLLPSSSPEEAALIPFYYQIEQSSLDVQGTKGAWLWKLEAIYNQNNFEDFYAYVGGFEVTAFGITDEGSDLGYLLEYHHNNIQSFDGDIFIPQALQNDLFVGLRWTGNDVQTTNLLTGLMIDLDNGSTFYNLEFNRRLGATWTIGADLRLFWNIDATDALSAIEQDDYLEIRLARYF